MSYSFRPTLARLTFVLAAAVLLPQGATAQALPDARELIAKHNAATGAEMLTKISSITTKGRVSMPSQGLEAEMEIYQAKPNKSAQKINIPGVGTITSGFDGTNAWSDNPMQGPRVLEGKELETVKAEADFMQALRQPSHVETAQTVEKSEMGGQPCWKVKLKWKSGREGVDCYHTETGMLVGTTQTTDSPMGSVETTTLLSEYKDFNGRKTPTKMTQSVMGMEQIITILSVEYDSVPAAAFEPPAAIKAMLKPAGQP